MIHLGSTAGPAARGVRYAQIVIPKRNFADTLNISGLQVFASSEPVKNEEALLFDASPLIFRTVFSGQTDPVEAIKTIDKLCSRLIKRRSTTYSALVLDGAGAKAQRQQLIATAQNDVKAGLQLLQRTVKALEVNRPALEKTSGTAMLKLKDSEKTRLVESIQADLSVTDHSEDFHVVIKRRIDTELPHLGETGRQRIAGSLHAELFSSACLELNRVTQVNDQLNFEYKGNRAITEWRKYSIEVVKRLMEPDRGGFTAAPVVFKEGAEADDVIATLTKRFLNDSPAVNIVIASPDKDFLQLLTTRRVRMLKGLSAIHRGRGEIARDFVVKEYGIEAEQFVDYQALVGDDVDNIPGVKGIGPKRAAALLREYGTLEAILNASRDRTKSGTMWKELHTSADIALLSKQLATLKADLDMMPQEPSVDWRDYLRVKWPRTKTTKDEPSKPRKRASKTQKLDE